jgi:hypothetical protein
MGWRDFFGKLGLAASVKAPPVPEPQPFRTLQDLDDFIEREDLGAIAAILRERATPCFHLFPDSGATSPGETRLGGVPDLPAGSSWPRGPDGPLPFLAQLDLADVARRCGSSPLPAQGLLSFFNELHDVYPRKSPLTVVLHSKDVGSLLPLEAPPGADVYEPTAVRFEPGVTLPVEELFFQNAVTDVLPDFDQYVLSERCGLSSRGGQLLGHAITFQHDLQARLALAGMGHAVDENLLLWDTPQSWEEAKQQAHTLRNGSIYRPWSAKDDDEVRWLQAHRREISAELREWQLLFRLDSNREMNFWINDADSLYLFIRKDALKAADFSCVVSAATQS